MLKRILIIAAWVIASLALWSAACNAMAWSLSYLPSRQVPVPFHILDLIYTVVALAGVVLVPAITALLAMRGKLPGTRRPHHQRGFPIEPPHAEQTKEQSAST